MAKWITLNERVGYLGSKRDEMYTKWNSQYGKDKWKLVWRIGDHYVNFRKACFYYEEAYYDFFIPRFTLLSELLGTASDIYDDNVSNIFSGRDYMIQETAHTHIQDIAIRRVVDRMGCRFEGSQLLQIRQEKGSHKLSMILSPGRVPFNFPELIERPEIKGWWKPKTVESFYQSNRHLAYCK